MPTYVLKCADGHVNEEHFTYEEYDEFKLSEGDACEEVIEVNDYGEPSGYNVLCMKPATIQIQVTPFNFATTYKLMDDGSINVTDWNADQL